MVSLIFNCGLGILRFFVVTLVFKYGSAYACRYCYKGVVDPPFLFDCVYKWVVFFMFASNGHVGEPIMAVCEIYELYCLCRVWIQWKLIVFWGSY